MTTYYQKMSVELQEDILNNGYYTLLYKDALSELKMTSDGVKNDVYTIHELWELWQEFWEALPDSPAIRCKTFYKLCNLCEELI